MAVTSRDRRAHSLLFKILRPIRSTRSIPAVAEPGSAGSVEQLGEFVDVTDADHYVQQFKICLVGPVGRSLDPPFRLLRQRSMPTIPHHAPRRWVKRVIPILDMLRKRVAVWMSSSGERDTQYGNRRPTFVRWKYYLCNAFIIHTRD